MNSCIFCGDIFKKCILDVLGLGYNKRGVELYIRVDGEKFFWKFFEMYLVRNVVIYVEVFIGCVD